MITLNVFLTVKIDQLTAFKAVIVELVAKSSQEKGNLLYEYYQRDNKFFIVEHWQDDNALALHNQTLHFKQFVEQAPALLAEPLHIQRYDT